MTLQSPPYAMQNASHTAALFRQAAASQLLKGGPCAGSDFTVAAQGTPNMSVAVSAGQAWVKGTSVANYSGTLFSAQGDYYVVNDGSVTLTIATADPTNPRIDLVYVQVIDTAYGGGSNIAQLGVVTGTPAGTPTVPGTPANAHALGQVRVNAGAASITNAVITNYGSSDTTVSQGDAVGLANIFYCTSTTRPTTGLRAGSLIFETDTTRVMLYTGSAWVGFGNVHTTLPLAVLYQSTAQTGLGTGTISITCGTTGYDTYGKATGGHYVIPQTGYYLIAGQVAATSISTTTQFSAGCLLNGSAVVTSFGAQWAPGPGFVNVLPFQTVLFCNAGDTVTLAATNTAGTWSTYVGTTADSSKLTVLMLASQ